MNKIPVNRIRIIFYLLSLYILSVNTVQAAAANEGVGVEVAPGDKSLVETVANKSSAPIQGEEQNNAQLFHGSIDTYEKAIVAIEDQYGVYDGRLAEQLVGLGAAYRSQGEHKVAIAAFKRAAHINRINHGLYSLSQAPMLSYLVESYSADGDWKNANDKQQLLYDLKSRNYGENNPKLLTTLSDMVEWHLRAYQRGSNVTHLLRAWELNQHAIAIIETNFGPHDLQLDEALIRQVSTSYRLAEYQMSISAPPSYFSANQQHPRHFTQPDIPEQDLRFQSMLSPYRDGKTALLRRVELYRKNPLATSDNQADALVKLGDWYFYFDKRESAIKTYQEAEKILAATDRSEARIAQVFGQPHMLVFEANNWSEEARDQAKQQGFVEAKFDITAAGRAKDVQILESEPPNMMDALVQQSIKASRYRPRIVGGKPVLTKGVIYRHVFHF